MNFRQLLTFWVLSAFVCVARGQDVSTRPEINEMFRNGIKAELTGSYTDAITVYKQLLNLEPGNDLVTYQLATMYYRTQQYDKAVESLQLLANRKMKKEEVYTLLVSGELAQKHIRGALTAAKAGVKLYPDNGMMYFQEGMVYETASNWYDAFRTFADGIEHAPRFANNYREAYNCALSRAALPGSTELVWALMYGETYLLLRKDTSGQYALKKELFRYWKIYFDQLGDAATKKNLSAFETAVWDTKLATTPAVSGGFNLTNFTKCQHTFVEKWNATYSKRYPFYLFQFYAELNDVGLLDIYNRWFWSEVIEGSEGAITAAELQQLTQWLHGHPLNIAAHRNYISQ
ncbi:MAG: hypothetical protein EBZ77_06925 [Chitinophagia bacterium]|nr:hypothetical protein [Chitinophagia bacterium]